MKITTIQMISENLSPLKSRLLFTTSYLYSCTVRERLTPKIEVIIYYFLSVLLYSQRAADS